MTRKRREKWWQVFRTKPTQIFWYAEDSNDNRYGNGVRLGQPEGDYNAYRMVMYNMAISIQEILDQGHTITFVVTAEHKDGLRGFIKERGVV